MAKGWCGMVKRRCGVVWQKGRMESQNGQLCVLSLRRLIRDPGPSLVLSEGLSSPIIPRCVMIQAGVS